MEEAKGPLAQVGFIGDAAPCPLTFPTAESHSPASYGALGGARLRRESPISEYAVELEWRFSDRTDQEFFDATI
ncbi:MAG: hypothetical protein WAK66_00355, partial [Methylocystis sp.]